MSKHLTKKEIDYIIECIRNWDISNEKLTWDNLCLKISKLLRRKPTRQSLNMHENIVIAIQVRKKNLRDTPKVTYRPSNLQVAAKRIANLERRVIELEMENNLLLEKNVKLNYCCYLKGINENEINSYFPAIKRCE